MTTDLPYQLSLREIPHIGNVHAKILCDHFGKAEEIFRASARVLESIEGIGPVRARKIKEFRDFAKAETEIRFMQKYGISPLFIKDKEYPQRLQHCYDPPVLLFYKGNADLNSTKIISVVGTRNNSEYGKAVIEKMMKELAAFQVLVVSGLAFGIDAAAHRAAIKNGLQTVGVLAHGLSTIYPAEHSALAREMIKNGGIISEFSSGVKPDKHNFPSRNRIVAGISDATIVIESGVKGGSMITADIACGYNKEVFAVPGRINDPKSVGCNQLIRNNKAILLDGAGSLIDLMGWNYGKLAKPTELHGRISEELPESERLLLSFLIQKNTLGVDELESLSGMSAGSVASALLGLEIKNLARHLPGKRYQLFG